MDRRKFIKGSAIIGASVVLPNLLSKASGMIASDKSRKTNNVITADRRMVGTLPVL